MYNTQHKLIVVFFSANAEMTGLSVPRCIRSILQVLAHGCEVELQEG